MIKFNPKNVSILPHAEDYRRLYNIAIADVLTCLNTPDKKEGLSTDHYTTEKSFGKFNIYIYYYQTLPLQNRGDSDMYAVVDFIGYTAFEDIPKQNK